MLALQARTSAKVVAAKVETEAQFTTLASYGAALFQACWVARPNVFKTRLVTPKQINVLQLLNLVRREASTAEIELVLKRDPMLGFNLLRMINSTSLGRSEKVISPRRAVVEFQAAVSLDGTFAHGFSRQRISCCGWYHRSGAGLHDGVVRRWHADARRVRWCFLVGVFSLLDDMLGMPMDQGLA